MLLPTTVTKRIQETTGIDIRQAKGIERLTEAIAEKTGERIGETTLRRLYGFVEDERSPRPYTLDIIAHFLDYGNWDQMMKELCPSDSHFISSDQTFQFSELKDGAIVEIRYFPDRIVRFEATGDHHFKVVRSVNSKLMEGDVAVIDDMLLHFPLYVRSVSRDGIELGRYIAGEEYGISEINII